MQTEVVVGDLDKVKKYVPEQKELARYVARTLDVRLGEALFARAVLLVEGATDMAVLSQAAKMLGSDLSANGVVVAAPGKSSIPIAAAVLDSLDIPYYVVFDVDGNAEDKEACSECGRGKHERRDGVAKENQRIFDALGVQEADFPLTGARDRFACFATNLEGFLGEEIEGFQDSIQAVASEMQWKAKSPEVYGEVVERNGSNDLPDLLGDVIDKIMNRAKSRIGLNS